MTKDPFRKLSKAFVLIVVILTHVSKWEAIIVCRSRTPRGMRTVPLTIICHDIAPSDPSASGKQPQSEYTGDSEECGYFS